MTLSISAARFARHVPCDPALHTIAHGIGHHLPGRIDTMSGQAGGMLRWFSCMVTRTVSIMACLLLLSLVVLSLAACGGGGGSSAPATRPASAAGSVTGNVTPSDDGSTGGRLGDSGTGTAITPSIASTSSNSVDVVVDGGALRSRNGASIPNAPYVTVTICQPGSTTACQKLDHVLLDTGSVGLRIFADALDGTATPPTMVVESTGQDVRECVNFVGGFSWGAMGMVDMTLGSAIVARLPIMIIGDPRAGLAPDVCAQGPSLNSGLARGMKGILGVGHARADCGPACEDVRTSRYYACAPGTSTCQRVAVPVAQQISNPVQAIGTSVNGIALQFPTVTTKDVGEVHGRMYFGVGTHPDNTPTPATQIYQLDSLGLFTTYIDSKTVTHSTVDSGSNAIWYPGTLDMCPQHDGFYCPGEDTLQTARIASPSGIGAAVTFPVENADAALKANRAVIPGLAGRANSPIDQSDWFLWGMPFHFGRTIFVLFEGGTYQKTGGPALIF